MREILALFLVFAGAVSYVVLMETFGWYQRWPVVHLLVLAAGTIAAVFAWRRRESRGGRILSGVVVALAFAITLLFTWWTLSYSTYETTDRGPEVGVSVASIVSGVELSDGTGQPTPIWRPDDAGTLLVFYRGHW